MQTSPGKYRGMQRLGDENGMFAMVAIDQRNPMLEPIRKIRGLPDAPYRDVAEVKDVLARHLAPYASAMLVDPIYAFPRVLPILGRAPGLILSYEHGDPEQTSGGRKSMPIPGWNVGKIRRAGADAVKVLVWYRADAPEEVRSHQKAFVRAAGEACAAEDIVHLLEILVYPLPGEDPARVRADRSRLVLESLRDFLDPAFGVDIYKVEPPAALTDVPDPDGPEAGGVQALYDQMAAMLDRPWVLLSAGAGAEDFRRSLIYACRAGASGYLCGRAIWQEAFATFPDLDAMERLLTDSAVPYLQSLNVLTRDLATPWPRLAGEVAFAHAGPTFPADYGD